MKHKEIDHAIAILKKMISIPSFSKHENDVAEFLFQYLVEQGVQCKRHLNNVFSWNLNFDSAKPTLLFNSHIDTVKPNAGYTRDPFNSEISDNKVYGLGSNDAGGSVVCQLITFLNHYTEKYDFNIVWSATAEEEISGQNGIEALLKSSIFSDTLNGSKIFAAIVGEPTEMQMVIAEKGLMVIDATSTGNSGHAAHGDGLNAIYQSMEDIARLKELSFDKVSDLTGKTTAQVTVIETENKAHNVIPDHCRFVIDVRLNELYTHEEVLDIFRKNLKSQLNPRSTRLKSTVINKDHPLILAGLKIGLNAIGSSTLSDKALMPFPALKCGPGNTLRSHTADEFITITDLEKGLYYYDLLLKNISING